MSTQNPQRLPLQLPWLARRAGLSDAKAEALWLEASRQAEKTCGSRESSDYYRTSMDTLRASLAAESRRLDGLSYVRPWSRLQRQVLKLQMSWFEAGTVIAARTTRALARPLRQSRCSCC